MDGHQVTYFQVLPSSPQDLRHVAADWLLDHDKYAESEALRFGWFDEEETHEPYGVGSGMGNGNGQGFSWNDCSGFGDGVGNSCTSGHGFGDGVG